MSYYLLIEPPNNGITEDELYHHGILGQKWGVRRFQPYRVGMKVAGGKVVGAAKKVKQRVTGTIEGIKEHRAAKKEAKAQKKAEAARKAAEAHQLSKEEAINKGTVEDLAKFKGELTGEEYRRAFDRLRNEATLQQMIDANKKSGWDIVDDGMKVVDRLSKYANTAANFKQNVDRLTQGSKDEKAKKEQDEKNDVLNKVKSVTELNELQKKYHFNQDEYNKALNTFANKKAYQDRFKDDDDFVDQNDKARREYESERQKANESAWAKKTADEQWEQYKKSMYRDYQKARRADSNRAKDGSWRPYDDGDNSGSNSSKSAAWEHGTTKTNQLLLTMKDSTPSSSSVNSGKRVISGFTSPGSKNYRVTSQLEFGGSKVTRATAQSSKPSSSLEATRRAVEATKRERERQKEIDKKRKSKMG